MKNKLEEILMKKVFIAILFCGFHLFAQDNIINLKQNTNGIITTNDGAYLILEHGFMQIIETNVYQEYYRRIYNDSTLISPNTELKSNFIPNIIPYISPSNIQNKYEFSEDLNVGLLLQFQENNQMSLTTYGQVYIDSLLNKK